MYHERESYGWIIDEYKYQFTCIYNYILCMWELHIYSKEIRTIEQLLLYFIII